MRTRKIVLLLALVTAGLSMAYSADIQDPKNLEARNNRILKPESFTMVEAVLISTMAPYSVYANEVSGIISDGVLRNDSRLSLQISWSTAPIVFSELLIEVADQEVQEMSRPLINQVHRNFVKQYSATGLPISYTVYGLKHSTTGTFFFNTDTKAGTLALKLFGYIPVRINIKGR